MNGSPAECPREKTYGQNHIKRIDEVNILVNDGNLTISSSCLEHPKELVGSFLIQISNCSVYMDGEEYINLDTIIPVKSFIPTTGLKVNTTKIVNRIPLEYLQTFHLEHRENLRKLNLTTENIHGRISMFKWLSFGWMSTTTILTIGIICVWLARNAILHKIITEEQQTTRPELAEEQGPVPPFRQPRLIPQ